MSDANEVPTPTADEDLLEASADAAATPEAAQGDRGDRGTVIPPKQTSSLRSILDEIGAEEAVARLELRIQNLESELDRSDRRLHEFERARRGELDVMRARVEDVLGAVESMLGEQREAGKDLEGRLSEQVTEATRIARTELHELRDTLTPHVQQAVHDAESHVSALRGEVARLGTDVGAKFEQSTKQSASLQQAIVEIRQSTAAQVTQQLEAHAGTVADLRAELTSRVDTVETAGEARQQDVAQRMEALRRELDAATGELRAAVSLRTSELKSDVKALRDELTEAADVGQSRDDDLEARWIDATRDVADKIEQAVARVESQVRKEREDRQEALDRADERLNEATAKLDALGDRIEAVKRPRVDDVRRGMTDVESRVEALQGQVAAAVGQIASELNNRVAVVGGDLEAVRATAAFHTEELARLGGVSGSVDELRQEVSSALDQLRKELAGLKEQARSGVSADDQVRATKEAVRIAEAASAQTREVVTTLTSMQEELRALAGLRQEVRDQASTLVEAVTRAEAAEQAAIQTREAVAAAVRRGREARAVSRPADPAEAPET